MAFTFKNWHRYLLPTWLNCVTYWLDYELQDKKPQKIYRWLFWVYVTE